MNSNASELTPLWYTVDQAARSSNKSRVSIYALPSGKTPDHEGRPDPRALPGRARRYRRTCTEQQAAPAPGGVPTSSGDLTLRRCSVPDCHSLGRGTTVNTGPAPHPARSR